MKVCSAHCCHASRRCCVKLRHCLCAVSVFAGRQQPVLHSGWGQAECSTGRCCGAARVQVGVLPLPPAGFLPPTAHRLQTPPTLLMALTYTPQVTSSAGSAGHVARTLLSPPDSPATASCAPRAGVPASAQFRVPSVSACRLQHQIEARLQQQPQPLAAAAPPATGSCPASLPHTACTL